MFDLIPDVLSDPLSDIPEQDRRVSWVEGSTVPLSTSMYSGADIRVNPARLIFSTRPG